VRDVLDRVGGELQNLQILKLRERADVAELGAAQTDGCNTCTCEPDLSISCTEVACPDADLSDAGEPLDAGDIADAGVAGDDAD
jgi:hypothetical protein